MITTNETSEFVKGKVIVMTGCLDGDVQVEPKQEFYVKDRCAWIGVLDGTQKFQGMV